MVNFENCEAESAIGKVNDYYVYYMFGQTDSWNVTYWIIHKRYSFTTKLSLIYGFGKNMQKLQKSI